MKQFKLVALLLVSASLFSMAASAHVSYKGEMTPATVCDQHRWTGYYAGLNLGLVQHTLSMTDNQAASFNATIQQVGNPALTGGFQAGYRRELDLSQIAGVYGVELSANFSNTTFTKQYGSGFALYQLHAKNTLNNVFLLQFIGGIATNKTLLFVSAGLSLTNISGNVVNQSTVPFFNSFNVDKHPLGTAFGGGVEYAYNDAISVRLKVDAITPNAYTTSDNTGNSYQISNSIVQATLGVNYQIG